MTATPESLVPLRAQRRASRASIAWASLAGAYAIAFLQRLAPESVNAGMTKDFHVDAAGFAALASGYFWGYAAMQIPAGILVDRYGVRRVMLASLTVSTLASALFAAAPDFRIAFLARLAGACGDALVFAALLKFVAMNFSDRRFGLVSGLSQLSGYLGGALATAPLVFAASAFGWRSCFFGLAGLGAFNLVFAARALEHVRAAPVRTSRTMPDVAPPVPVRAGAGCAMAFAAHFAVVTTLSGVWGIPMVAHVLGVAPSAAGLCLLAFMVANAIGSVALGWAADRIRSLPTALGWICLMRMALVALLAPWLARSLGFVFVTGCFGLLGLLAGGTVPLVLKCTKAFYSGARIGLGASFNTTAAGLWTGFTQLAIGWGLAVADRSAAAAPQGVAPIADKGWLVLLALLLVASLPGLAGPLLMPRTPQSRLVSCPSGKGERHVV